MAQQLILLCLTFLLVVKCSFGRVTHDVTEDEVLLYEDKMHPGKGYEDEHHMDEENMEYEARGGQAMHEHTMEWKTMEKEKPPTMEPKATEEEYEARESQSMHEMTEEPPTGWDSDEEETDEACESQSMHEMTEEPPTGWDNDEEETDEARESQSMQHIPDEAHRVGQTMHEMPDEPPKEWNTMDDETRMERSIVEEKLEDVGQSMPEMDKVDVEEPITHEAVVAEEVMPVDVDMLTLSDEPVKMSSSDNVHLEEDDEILDMPEVHPVVEDILEDDEVVEGKGADSFLYLHDDLSKTLNLMSSMEAAVNDEYCQHPKAVKDVNCVPKDVTVQEQDMSESMTKKTPPCASEDPGCRNKAKEAMDRADIIVPDVIEDYVDEKTHQVEEEKTVEYPTPEFEKHWSLSGLFTRMFQWP